MKRRASELGRGTPVTLTADQFRLLYCLMRQAGRVFTREEIIHATKGTDYPCTLKSVDVAIHHLRARIGIDVIQAVRGMGYSYVESLLACTRR